MKNKSLTIFLIILLSIIVVLCSIFYIAILTNKNFSKYFHLSSINFGYEISNELVLDKTYDGIFKEIAIDSKASDIEIKESTSEEVKVVIYGDKDKTKVDSMNDKLTITSDGKSCIGLCFHKKIAKIEIYLPSTYENKIIITNKYGNIKLGNFSNMNANIQMNCGDIDIGSLKQATITNDYGDIIINQYVEELEAIESCGDVKVNEVNSINVKNNYGDIKIHKVNKSLAIKDDCGDIEIDSLSIKENSTIKNDYGDIKIGSTNEIYIDAKTSLGDTKIKNNYQKSDVTLTIENDCGDIEVNN